jgi:tetratricopeptide (TPR) repeat protein
MTSRLIGKRYDVGDILGEGGMGIVHRAYDRLTGQTVALKQVTAVPEQSGSTHGGDTSIDFRLALAHEFKTLASLRHPNIISVLDYGFDEDRTPFFTMDYLENSRTIFEAASGQGQAVQLALLVQVLQALAYLHRRGIIHRDLKPANILVVNGTVKVLDFGLAMTRQAEITETAGTLAYMAPELLTGGIVSVKSDLYSLGMIAYEILAGKHPFDIHDNSRLVTDVLQTVPDVTALDAAPGIAVLIGRLLAKQPEDRPEGASEIIAAYNAATNRQMAYESPLTRDSFLQAAQFVGREAEMAQLSDALASAVEGTGSAWLIGGESGVGKSRLLDELRTQAMVRGVMVLRGQAVTEGGSPYYLWREALRWLAMTTPLSDLEASVLKILIPDIAALTGKTNVPDPAEIESQAAQERLVSAIVQIFKRQTTPLLVIMEDLHWAREGLDVLQRLSRTASGLPLLIIGSIRDDERPNLPDKLAEMHLMKLKRFDERGVAALCESMLGDTGRKPEVIELAQRETEGNVFFLIEVVRTLAEEAGQLEAIGTTTLPPSVFSGGIKKIVQRRLNRVPPTAFPLLQTAALIGRQLDLRLLKRLDASVKMDEWLTACSDAAVLEVQEERWRFAHDKLREGLLSAVSDERRRGLHQKIAQAIEAEYGASDQQIANLAFHWKMAQNKAKESHYATLAGEQALRNGANEVAVGYFRRALELGSESVLSEAHVEQQLSEALYGLGGLMEAKEHCQAALRLLGYPMPDTKAKMAGAFVAQGFRRVLQHRFPSRYLGKAADRRELLLEVVRAYHRLSVINYMRSDTLPTVLGTFYSLNLSELAGTPSPELARSYANFAVALGLVPMHDLSESYLCRALDVAQQAPQALRWVTLLSGAQHFGVGKLGTAEAELKQAIVLAENEGDHIGLMEGRTVLVMLDYHMGELERGQTEAEAVISYALARNAQHSYGSAVVLNAIHRQRQARKPMEDKLSELEAVLSATPDQGYRIVGYSLLAQHYLRAGEREKALDYAAKVTDFTFKSPSTSYFSLPGYIHVAELFLTLWENGDKAQARNAHLAIHALTKYARAFPFASPAALRCQGWSECIETGLVLSLGSWHDSLKAAQKIGMPYEEARTQFEIARHMNKSPERDTHLRRARELFERVDAQYDLAQVELFG